MRNINRRLLTLACALALVANGFIGVVAQEGKQERRSFVYQNDGKALIFRTDNDQEPRLQTPDPVAEAWVSSVAQVGGDPAFQFFTREMSFFDSRLVKDSPFSAEIVTESVQTLADGNRIVQRTEGRIYRDSQGRMRNEKTFKMGGSNTEHQLISISDPVSGISYTLDPQTKTARKINTFARAVPPPPPPAPTAIPPGTSEIPRKITVSGGVLQGSAIKRVQPPYPSVAKAAKASGAVQVQILISEAGDVIEAMIVSGHPLLREAALEAARQWQFKPTELSGKPVKVQGILTFNFTLMSNENPAPTAYPPTMPGIMRSGPLGMKVNASTEKLGKQMVEGIECEGTRFMTTLPAGAIGNENPIQTIREIWHSPELKMTIMTKQNDPRFGESTYRLTNIVRAEPDATLFQIPSDYTVTEGGSFGFGVGQGGGVGVGSGIGNGQGLEIKKRRPDQE
jgi:TonB family protein